MSVKGTGWISILALLGLLIGGFLGYQFPAVFGLIGVLGEFFVYALVLAAFVQLASTAILAADQIGQRSKFGRITYKVILLYLGMGLVGSLLGMLAASILRPGDGINAVISDLQNSWSPLHVFSVDPGLLGGFVLVALVIGAGAIGLGARFRTASNLIGQVQQVAARATAMLTSLLPLGLFALAAGLMAADDTLRTSLATVLGIGPSAGEIMMNSAGSYLGVAVVGLIVIGFVLLPVAMRLFGGIPIGSIFSSIGNAIATAFGTGASLTAYPMLQYSFSEDLGTDNRVTGIVLPVGNLFNVTATSFVVVVATLFLAQAADISLTFWQYLLVLIIPLFVGLGKVGLPAMTVVSMTVAAGILGFPSHIVAGLGMILIVDFLVERVRAAVNVVSDATAVSIASQFFEFKTARAGRESRSAGTQREHRDSSRARSERSSSDRRAPERSERGRGRESRAGNRRSSGRDTERQTERYSRRRGSDDNQSEPRERGRSAERSPFEMSAEQQPQFDVDLSRPSGTGRGRGRDRQHADSPPARPTQRRGGRSAQTSSEPDERSREKEKTDEREGRGQSGRGGRGRLSPETIARELQRVSEHLEQFDMESPPEETDNDNETVKTSAPAELAGRKHDRAQEQPERSQLSIELTTSEDWESLSDSTIPEKDVDEEEIDSPPVPSDEDDEDQEPIDEIVAISYGRGRPRRQDRTKSNLEAEETPDKLPDRKDGFSADEVTSFGRGKRKKTK